MTDRIETSAAPAKSATAVVVILSLGLILTACATVTTTTHSGERIVRSRQEFGEYVEQVLRYHNRVQSDLIDRYELADDPEVSMPAEISAAEAHMADSCRYLNEIVVTSAEGREPSLELKQKLMETVSECDYAAHAVAHLLDDGSHSVVMESTAAP